MKNVVQKIGVVIPTKNRRQDLLRAVKSVISQSRIPDELIIIDQSAVNDGETPVSGLLKNSAPISLKYCFNKNITGLTAAKNAAIKISESAILLFIDDDIILEPDFVKIILQAYTLNPELSGVGGVVKLPSAKNNGFKRFAASCFQIGPFRDHRALVQAGYAAEAGIVKTWLLSGGLSSLRREVFEHLRFDENLIGASPIEDMDFYSRAKQRNLRFALAVNAGALHNVSPVSRDGLRRAFERKTAGFAFIFARHVPKTPFNIFAFVWRNFGFFIDGGITAVQYRTFDPLKGVWAAWKSSLFKNIYT